MGPTKPTASSNTLMQVLLGGAYGWIVPIPSTTPEHGPSTVPHHTLLQPLPHTQSPHPPKPAAGVAWIPSPKLMYTEYVAIRRHRRWTSSAHTAAIGNRTRAPHTKHRENPHHPTLPHPTHQVTPTTHAHPHDTYACRKPCAERRQAHTTASHTSACGPCDLSHRACVREPHTLRPHPPKRATGVVPTPPPIPMHMEYMAIGKHRRCISAAPTPHTARHVPFCTQSTGKATHTTTSAPHHTTPTLPSYRHYICTPSRHVWVSETMG